MERSTKVEIIPDEVFQKYLGGKGLGNYLLLEYLEPNVDPLSSNNKLIFVTGLTTDTTIPAASRYGVFAKSPQTGFIGESFSGGHTAPAMKRTGYDAIILEGAADSPVFLHISDKDVEYFDATKLWGKESYESEDAILEAVNIKGAQAIVIGPAGENLVTYACIKNNYWRSAGRTGMGAVMGSKKVKGIIFSGSKKAPLANERMLKDYVKDFTAKFINNERTIKLRSRGTPWMVTTANEGNAFPTRYWTEGTYEHWRGISSDAMINNMEVRPRSCYRCFIGCGKLSKITQGRHKGLILEGPEYETIFALGGLCCIDKIEEVVYLNDICDRLGMDTISAGSIAGFAIEAGKRGKLSGMPDYGDVDGIAQLFYSIANKEGHGELLSKGIKVAAKELGLEEIAVHVKGLDLAGYDPRAVPGMGLGYSVSDRGACHLRSSFYMLELAGEVPKEQVEGKAKLFFDKENRNTIEDSLILCRFYMKFIDWDGLATIIKSITGMDFTKEDLTKLASRVTTLSREFNIREGWTREDDSLPTKFYKEPIGPKKNLLLRKEDVDRMIKDYYELHGWDESGIPLTQEYKGV
jgi:aldehyde:ferredoxin oxidoreductase